MSQQQITGQPASVVVVCGEVAEKCICDEPPKHEGPHLCRCRGSWFGTIGGSDFEVVTFPVAVPS